MPYKADLVSLINEWLAIITLAGGIFIGMITRRVKRQVSIEQLSKDIQAQDNRIAKLERQGNAEAVQLAEIVTTQTYIVRSLDEIKSTLKGKADKS